MVIVPFLTKLLLFAMTWLFVEFFLFLQQIGHLENLTGAQINSPSRIKLQHYIDSGKL